MGEFLTDTLRLNRNGRKLGRSVLASFLVLEMLGACGPSKNPAPQASSVEQATASPELVPTVPSPSLLPSETASPPAIQVECEAEQVNEWTRVPPSFEPKEIASIAGRLGVDVSAVDNGTLVWAKCSGGVWAEDLSHGVIADIDGVPPRRAVSSRCFMMISRVIPSPDVALQDVGGVCPELARTPAQ